jgi:hypothetical protein
MRQIALITLGLTVFLYSSAQKAIVLTVTNPTTENFKDVVVGITDQEKLAKINKMGSTFQVKSGNKSIPFQFVNHQKNRELLVQIDLKANEILQLRISKINKIIPQIKLTQAVLSVKKGGEWIWNEKGYSGRPQYEYSGGKWTDVTEYHVPEKHTDHSWDIRFEGPGWESDKVGYRLYMDWRNANDIFGKRTNQLALQHIGLDGFMSYHKMCDWGSDILGVGLSLGIGSIGHWNDTIAERISVTDSIKCRISYSGDLESKLKNEYNGWKNSFGKYNLISTLSIRAGSFLTRCDISISDYIDNLCTGLVTTKDTELIQGEMGEWCFLATFGLQSGLNDHLGMSVFFRKSDLLEVTKDRYSNVIVLKPINNNLTYYFGAVWEQSALHVQNKIDFERYLNSELQLLNSNLLNGSSGSGN